MRVGTVFKWNDFPDRRLGGELKPRWFVYLGDTGKFRTPVIAHINTTTTQLLDFQPGGKRYGHIHNIFKAEETPFECNCIIDFSSPLYHYHKEDLEDNPDIEIKGELNEEILKILYNKMVESAYYSKIVLLDIHRSYNMAGITGLKKPK
ncbi:MAG: hypothetical protein ACOC7U_01390 [Spirochaetota bacterium]